MSRDERTYDKVAEKFEDWLDIQASRPEATQEYPPPRPYTPEPNPASDVSRYVFAAIGIGIGFVLLALAALSFWSAFQWQGVARDGAFMGYTVVGVFLTIAGLGGILATWNHNFRVLTNPSAYHH